MLTYLQGKRRPRFPGGAFLALVSGDQSPRDDDDVEGSVLGVPELNDVTDVEDVRAQTVALLLAHPDAVHPVGHLVVEFGEDDDRAPFPELSQLLGKPAVKAHLRDGAATGAREVQRELLSRGVLRHVVPLERLRQKKPQTLGQSGLVVHRHGAPRRMHKVRRLPVPLAHPILGLTSPLLVCACAGVDVAHNSVSGTH